jgi:hypothetical protein
MTYEEGQSTDWTSILNREATLVDECSTSVSVPPHPMGSQLHLRVDPSNSMHINPHPELGDDNSDVSRADPSLEIDLVLAGAQAVSIADLVPLSVPTVVSEPETEPTPESGCCTYSDSTRVINNPSSHTRHLHTDNGPTPAAIVDFQCSCWYTTVRWDSMRRHLLHRKRPCRPAPGRPPVNFWCGECDGGGNFANAQDFADHFVMAHGRRPGRPPKN